MLMEAKSTAVETGRAASPLEPFMSDVIRRSLRLRAHERGILVTRDAQEGLSHLGSATWAPALAGPIHEASTNSPHFLPSGGGFIHISRRADLTLGLISVVRSSMVDRCGRLMFVRSTWCRDMAHHSSLVGSLCSLRCHGDRVSALPSRPGPALVGLSWDLGVVMDY
ncbi:hypothetical protein BHE74_00004292 [Ensete ventricosum]|nr:hypothetical protein BHE74_00004292 [Ensete ventricosum]